MKFLNIFILLLLPVLLLAQLGDDIPADRKIEWQHAGYKGDRPLIKTTVDITSFTDCYSDAHLALQSANGFF